METRYFDYVIDNQKYRIVQSDTDLLHVIAYTDGGWYFPDDREASKVYQHALLGFINNV